MNPPPAPERIEERDPCAASADPEPEAAPSRLAVAIDAIEAELDKATSRVEQIKAEIAALLREKRSEEKDVAAMRDALAYLRARVRDPEPPTDPEPRPEDGPDPAQIQATPEPEKAAPRAPTRPDDPTPGTNSAHILAAVRALGDGTPKEIHARAFLDCPGLRVHTVSPMLNNLAGRGLVERSETPEERAKLPGNAPVRWRAVR